MLATVQDRIRIRWTLGLTRPAIPLSLSNLTKVIALILHSCFPMPAALRGITLIFETNCEWWVCKTQKESKVRQIQSGIQGDASPRYSTHMAGYRLVAASHMSSLIKEHVGVICT